MLEIGLVPRNIFDLVETLAIYAHVLPSMQRDVADMTNRIFGEKEDF